MKVELPGDQWAEILDPQDILRKHIRKVRLAYTSGDTIGESMELGREAILTAIVVNWSLEQPVPSTVKDPADVFGGLSRAVWYALEKIADDYQQHFGDPSDGDKPVDPQEPSTV